MALYPTEVPVDEAQITRLTATFKSAYKDIVAEITTTTNFGVANRKAILAQIEQILAELGVNVQEFIEKEIPNYYEMGASDAVKQLHNIGADVNVSTGFNRIHKEAIAALVDDTSTAFIESVNGVNRSAQILLGRAYRQALTQKIAKGMISGEALADIRKMLKGVLEEQGLKALTDKGGKTWDLDTYAEMLFRTKSVEARNRGLINRMAENDYDLVQVSSHLNSCELCYPWQGKILSVSGDTPGYDTLTKAEEGGLFHPNCKHAINVLAPSIAKETQAYDINTGKYGNPGASVPKS
jgi:hypothetical protein